MSDHSLAELHAFAASIGMSLQAFDHDHYDLDERRYPQAVAAGAVEVGERELVARLRAAGLRVRRQDRTPKRDAATAELKQRWAQLLDDPHLGEELIAAYRQPSRHYHDVRHVLAVLQALDVLASDQVPQADSRTTRLAAWFHDAVYDGQPLRDEQQSAQLARERLSGLLPDDQVAEVARLVEVTIDHAPATDDAAGRALSDADLSVLGLPPGRYDVYVRDVRTDYRLLTDEQWRTGRSGVLEGLLARDHIFATQAARDRWEARARSNLSAELQRWK